MENSKDLIEVLIAIDYIHFHVYEYFSINEMMRLAKIKTPKRKYLFNFN
jgi:hypothetical protein